MRFFVLWFIVGISALAQAASSHPNVLVILADDMGWGDLSSNGNTNLSTPQIDSIGKAGATLDRFFVCPVCSPTRAEFLTGRYYPRGGVHDVSTGGERLNLGDQTIAEVFKGAGYATGAFGKWHNGTQYPYHPNARGFDEYYGFTSGHWGGYFDPPLDHNGHLTKGKGYIIDDLTNHAMQFITEHKDGPFFCYVPFNTPHTPLQVPQEYWDRFATKDITMRALKQKMPSQKEDIDFTRAVLAMMENMDWNVGRLLKHLDDLHLAENTIVIFFSDNGPNSWRWNGGMKGKKGNTDEGGVRSPFEIRWPGKIAPGKHVSQIAGAIDLLPTLADAANISLKSPKPLDGKSLKPLLAGDVKNWPDRMIFSTWGGNVSVRTQQYRLDNSGALFDMQADPGQTQSVAKEHPEIAERLSKAVAVWKDDVQLAAQRDDHRPFTVGYAEFPRTMLPARDGIAHGGIERSSRAPNCSYFTKWTSTEGTITWDIEVHSSGKYEAIVHYTCPQSDLGSDVALDFNGSSTHAVVNEANDPPLIGQEIDRVPRTSESFVKDFKPMSLGTFNLKAGRGLLTLHALQMPGKSVMDVRMVELVLVK
jgi:arylsulfatase A-like enzyme